MPITMPTTSMNFNLENIIQFFSILLPMYITFFMGMSGIFNNDFQKFGVWLGGVTMSSFILILAQYSVVDQLSIQPSCNVYNILPVKTPAATSSFIMFTLMYLVYPMREFNSWNYSVIAVFLILFVFDFVTKLRYQCTTVLHIVGGGVFGSLAALGWYTIIKSAGGDKLLYFNLGSSNNVYCSKPKQQTFKCSVYKNGQLISSN